MQRSLGSLAGMATSAFGAGTYAAMRQATSPKTILEHIINFFTCGGVRRRNETQYKELIEVMADTLNSSMPWQRCSVARKHYTGGYGRVSCRI